MKKIFRKEVGALKTRDGRQGSVLLYVLFVMLLLFSLGMAYLTLVLGEIGGASSSKDAMQALFLADAGIEAGIAKLIENPTFFDPDGFNIDFKGTEGQVTVTVSKGNPAKVTSLAHISNARRKVEAIVSRGGLDEEIEILTWRDITP